MEVIIFGLIIGVLCVLLGFVIAPDDVMKATKIVWLVMLLAITLVTNTLWLVGGWDLVLK